MAEREGTLVGVWLNDDELKRLDTLAKRMSQSRLVRNNRSEAIRALVRVITAEEVINKLLLEVISHTQSDAPNGQRVAVA
jgi:hypothetical protein